MKSDIEIAQETKELPINEIAAEVDLKKEDLEPYGYDKAKISWQAINRIRQNKHFGKLILVTGDLSYIILLAVYGVDSVLTIVHRLMLHENIGQPHRKHLYQIMANELKVPHVVVSSLYMMVQAVLVVGFVLSSYHWRYLGISLVVLSVVYVSFMKKFFYFKHQCIKIPGKAIIIHNFPGKIQNFSARTVFTKNE